jgi:hypothetical protein
MSPLTGISTVEQYGGFMNALLASFGQRAEVVGIQLYAPVSDGSTPMAGGTGSFDADLEATTAKVNAWLPADAGQLQFQIKIVLEPASAPATAWMDYDAALALAYGAK